MFPVARHPRQKDLIADEPPHDFASAVRSAARTPRATADRLTSVRAQ
jgi:hypothetical protein